MRLRFRVFAGALLWSYAFAALRYAPLGPTLCFEHFVPLTVGKGWVITTLSYRTLYKPESVRVYVVLPHGAIRIFANGRITVVVHKRFRIRVVHPAIRLVEFLHLRFAPGVFMIRARVSMVEPFFLLFFFV